MLRFRGGTWTAGPGAIDARWCRSFPQSHMLRSARSGQRCSDCSSSPVQSGMSAVQSGMSALDKHSRRCCFVPLRPSGSWASTPHRSPWGASPILCQHGLKANTGLPAELSRVFAEIVCDRVRHRPIIRCRPNQPFGLAGTITPFAAFTRCRGPPPRACSGQCLWRRSSQRAYAATHCFRETAWCLEIAGRAHQPSNIEASGDCRVATFTRSPPNCSQNSFASVGVAKQYRRRLRMSRRVEFDARVAAPLGLVHDPISERSKELIVP